MVIVVLPAYNEAENLPPLLGQLHATLGGGGAYHVLVVDDGSTDGTAAVADNQPQVSLERNPRNLGLTETMKRGLVRAVAMCGSDSDVIVTMDGDNTHAPEQIPAMLAAIEAGSDLVIASRYRRGARILGLSAFRKLLSLGGSWMFRLLLPMPGVTDYTCGYRAYRAGLMRTAFAQLGPDRIVEGEGFSSTANILLHLRVLRPAVAEVPLLLRYDRKRGASKMNIFRTVKATLSAVAYHRRR